MPSITIPEEGTYVLDSGETFENYEININQRDYQDTLLLPTVYQTVKVPPPSYSLKNEMTEIGLIKLNKEDSRALFKRCDSILKGRYIEYFNNGNIRIEGNFKNGYAKGEIKEYHQNGRVRIISVYDDEGYLIKQTKFDKAGTEIKK